MPIPVWSVKSWEPVRTTVRELLRATPRMRPLGLAFEDTNRWERGRRRGQVLWGTRMAGRQVGVAWDWTEVRASVVAVADPMQVLSNMLLVDDVGAVMERSTVVLHLNAVIHHVEWQARLLDAPGGAGHLLAA